MRNLLAVLLFVASGFVAEADDPWNRREAELKAAMLLNFGRFTVYPERKQEGNFKICVLGESPFGEAIDTIEGKQVREQVVETVLLEKYSAEVSACHILYISSSVDGGYKQFLQEVETEPILTVSQIEAFADNYGMIQMVDSGRVVKFRIDIERAKTSGLTISSRLLRIAVIVK